MALFRTIVVALTLVSFTACTSMQPIEDFRPSTIRERVAIGDHASVVYAKVRYDITVTAVDAEAVHGTTETGKAYRFPYEGIQSIDVEQTSGSRNWAMAVGAAVLVFIILLIRSIKPDKGSPDTGGSADPSPGV